MYKKDPKRQTEEIIGIHRKALDSESIKNKVEFAYSPVSKEKEDEKRPAQTEWEKLKSFAIVHFPEGADIHDITPIQRLVAIASVLGWSEKKIAENSGLSLRSIYRYLDPKENPGVCYFADQFRIKQSGDITSIQNENLFKFMRFVTDVLNSNSDSMDVKRLKFDVGKWNFEALRGKPGQTIEHKGIDLESVYKAIGNINVSEMTDEEKEEAFKKPDVH